MAFPGGADRRGGPGPAGRLEGDFGDFRRTESRQGFHRSSNVIGSLGTCRNLFREDFERFVFVFKLSSVTSNKIVSKVSSQL